jgi:hypothetical protein
MGQDRAGRSHCLYIPCELKKDLRIKLSTFMEYEDTSVAMHGHSTSSYIIDSLCKYWTCFSLILEIF